MSIRGVIRDGVDRLARRGRAMTASSSQARPETAEHTPAGLVESFGRERVTGWIAPPPGSGPVHVALLVNGTEVAATDAVAPAEREAWAPTVGFGFAMRELWPYLRTDHKVTVRVNGRSLPIVGHGMYFAPPRNGKHGLRTLRELQAQGRGPDLRAADVPA
ncbi:hypothetical protein SAMN05443575_1737 [Jatrophihabitans endophyticus]|uniref:Uncharacterized protein n=1 Tax=Jatrophihabitans endophyticus TaxID=1206085 RepID=A0A1M5I340_9ACTN|nr:hypothetical protein [Jatrophihabitans endophyticus]SHG22724.1 hypothetical protein SAMN05443575_1737 [Jatrophihabitans endophyticus]